MDIEKLLQALAEEGVDDETIQRALAKANDEEPKEPDTESESEKDANDSEDGKTEKDEPTSPDPTQTEDDLPEGNNEETGVVEEEGIPEEQPPLPPGPNEEDVVTPDPNAAPIEQPASTPVVPPELLEQLNGQQQLIEEQAKTIEGLDARIKSLEDALKQSGVLTEDETSTDEIGNEQQRPLTSGNAPVSDDFEDVLAELNGKSRRY